MVKEEPTFGELWPEIKLLVVGVKFLSAHNASLDLGVLQACCAVHTLKPPLLCTVKLARQTWNLFPTKLPNVCSYLGIPLDHHNATSDAEACVRIVLAARTASPGRRIGNFGGDP